MITGISQFMPSVEKQQRTSKTVNWKVVEMVYHSIKKKLHSTVMVGRTLGYQQNSTCSAQISTNDITSRYILLFHMANARCLAGIYILGLCKTRTSKTMNHPKKARKTVEYLQQTTCK